MEYLVSVINRNGSCVIFFISKFLMIGFARLQDDFGTNHNKGENIKVLYSRKIHGER